MKLSVIILSRDGNVSSQTTKSANFADEIIIWKNKDKKNIENYAELRNSSMETAMGDWVMFLDDDEYIGKMLAEEILESIKNTKFSGFYIPRKDLIFHKLQNHGELGKQNLLRLAKKKSGKFVRPVHEYWQINGHVGQLRNPIYHLKNNFISGFITRMSSYAMIDSKIMPVEGKPYSFFRLATYPIAKFFYNYIFRLGFLDGYPGLFISCLMSIQSLTVRVFQWEQER